MRPLLVLSVVLLGCGSSESGHDAGPETTSEVAPETSDDVPADGREDAGGDTGEVGLPDVPDAEDADEGGGEGDVPPACTPAFEPPRYVPAADDRVAYAALLEAAGYGSNDNSNWVALAAGDFCGGDEPELALLKNSASYLSVLRGPTPHAVRGSDPGSSSANPWRALAAADFDGDGKDELLALRQVTVSGTDDVLLLEAGTDCSFSRSTGLEVGGPGNSDWVGVAAADFDGDGTPEAAALRRGAPYFVWFDVGAGTLTSAGSAALDGDTTHPWRALAAGDLDADGRAELAAAREARDGADTVFAYRWNAASAGFVRIASSNLGGTGNSAWVGGAVGDFNGDGTATLALLKNAHSNLALFRFDGTATLAAIGSSDLVSDADQPWRALAAGDFLRSDEGAEELLLARQADGTFAVDLFVYGNPFHAEWRAAALRDTKAQYASEPRPSGADAPADLDALRSALVATHTSVYSFLLYDTTGQDYLDFVRFLDETRDFCVDGRQLRVWVTLIPPTETTSSGQCSVPADSPLTDFNESDLVTASGGRPACQDYVGWSEVFGRLAAVYPHFVAVNVDDFSHNVPDPFDPETVARMTARLRAQAPWMSFVPTSYYEQSGTFVGSRWPDLPLTLDSVLFYFRNEKEGAGPCTAETCDVPGSCPNACLAGECAEATIPNAPGEIEDMTAWLPEGRKLQFGLYASRHSTCGTPSIRYVHDLLETAWAQPSIDGTTVYTLQTPTEPCLDALSSKACAVQAIYGAR